MLRMFVGLSAIVLSASVATAGPIGTYYLTDYQNTSGSSTLDAIRGNAYVQNPSIRQLQEGPIAIVGPFVRTTGYQNGFGGGEYVSSPNLTVTADGNTWTSGINTGIANVYFDGTTDLSHNYTVDYRTGNVIATDLKWGGAGTVVFSTRTYQDLMITYDRFNNSLWIQNFGSGVITDYTLGGSFITSFGTPHGTDAGAGSTALAMDVDHTLWFDRYGTGYIEHYATNGTYLGEQFYAGLGLALGGEIAAGATPIPEPSTVVMSSVLLGLFGLSWTRKRLQASK